MRHSKLAVLLITLVLATPPHIAQAQSVDQLLQQGSAAQAARNYAGAETIWQQVIRIDPTNMAAYMGLGYIQTTRGQWEEAIATYRQLIQIYPSLARSLLWAGDRPRAAGQERMKQSLTYAVPSS